MNLESITGKYKRMIATAAIAASMYGVTACGGGGPKSSPPPTDNYVKPAITSYTAPGLTIPMPTDGNVQTVLNLSCHAPPNATISHQGQLNVANGEKPFKYTMVFVMDPVVAKPQFTADQLKMTFDKDTGVFKYEPLNCDALDRTGTVSLSATDNRANPTTPAMKVPYKITQ